MVKNVLLDRTSKPGLSALSNLNKDKSSSEIVGSLVPIKGGLAPSPIVPEDETPIAKPASIAVENVHGGLDKAKEELMKFIDDDDEEVEQFFNKDSSLLSAVNDNCKEKEQPNMFPLSTTCDPVIQDLSSLNKSVKASSSCLNQDKKNVMLLNEYENESTMNGGQLFGGLSAYDVFDNNFQLYAC